MINFFQNWKNMSTLITNGLIYNRLTNNVKKSSVVNYKRKITKTPVKVGKENVFETNSLKYLGLYIDKSLKNQVHVQHTCRKMAKRCGSFI